MDEAPRRKLRAVEMALLVALAVPLAPGAADRGALRASEPPEVLVDPPDPLRIHEPLGEWTADADLEGWSAAHVASLSVASGLLAGVDDAANPLDPALEIAGLSDGPDLDLGYNDWLEVRLRLPEGPSGGVRVQWGTTAQPGADPARTASIPPSSIPTDGLFHTYRLDMGLEPGWKGYLRDLSILPLAGPEDSGKSFALDHVRVGDAGPDYLPNRLYYPEGTPDVHEAASKHFRIVWGPDDEVSMSWGSFDTNSAAIARGNLRNMEDQWQVYTKLLGYREPSQSVDPAKRDGNLYKVNLYVGRTGLARHSGGGYFMGYSGSQGFGWLTIDTSGLRFDPPSWVNPHELGHVFQVHQAGFNDNPYMGFWWECHANWMREEYLRSPLYPERDESGFGEAFPRSAHLYHGHGRHYYDHWPIWSYLEENPDGLPRLGRGFTARLWQEALPREYIYDELARLVPEVSIQDLLGLYVRRNVGWDYSNRRAILSSLGVSASLDWQGSYRRLGITDLVARPDDPEWWRVPLEHAPMQGAYNLVELQPEGSGAGRAVTVELRGLGVPERQADWRASLVAVSADGELRYGSVGGPGQVSIALGTEDRKVFLAVVATPDDFIAQEASEELYPYATHPARARFPWEARIVGATPAVFEPSNGGQAGRPHPNGGGFVASTARVDATAWVGPDAMVLDRAQVRGNARVEGRAVVEDDAYVGDSAVVSGHGRVRDDGRVVGFAKVREHGEVRGRAVIEGRARVIEHGTAAETLTVTDRAVVKGFAYAWDSPDGAKLSGNAIADGDYAAGHGASDTVLFGWLVGADHAAARAGLLPGDLFATYSFDRRHPSLLEDSPGVSHGWLHGDPPWSAEDGGHEGVVTFSGSGQYATLPRCISDVGEMTIAAWIRWAGGPAGQRILELGSAADRVLFLTPLDSSGSLLLSVRNGSASLELRGAPLQPGAWTHVAMTLDGTNAALYVGGSAVASGAVSVSPDDLNAPDDASTPQASYLGRGRNGDYFRGAIDLVQVWSRALGPDEVLDASAPPPQRLVSRGATWRYDDSGRDLGTGWRAAEFDDAAWRSGPAQLGFGDGDEATAIRSGGQVTSYFRRSFAVADPDRIDALSLALLRDDGAVVYLNGQEVFRSNLPEGAIVHSTLASAVATPEDESTTYHRAAVDAALLARGRNAIAVEVHQASATSSDLSFDLELMARMRPVGGPTFHRGDAGGDGSASVADAVAVLEYLFRGESSIACLDAADADDSGDLDIADAVRILAWLFLGAAVPPSPGPPGTPCGPDPSPDAGGDLGCAAYTGC